MVIAICSFKNALACFDGSLNLWFISVGSKNIMEYFKMK